MMNFMGTDYDYFWSQEFLCLSQWEPLFIYLNFFPIVPILSVILWPFHIKSNNTKETALMNSKTHSPKMFIPLTRAESMTFIIPLTDFKKIAVGL